MRLCLAVLLSLVLGCASVPPKGVVRFRAGEAPTHIDGPMPGFGPFPTYSDAVLAACPLILSLPNAVTVQPSNPNFKLYWKLSTEYCAWIYMCLSCTTIPLERKSLVETFDSSSTRE